MEFDKIKRVRLQAEVEKSIRRFIEDNGLKEGDKLPSERELVEQLGVGRSSLRESLRALEALEVIKVVAGKGIFVAGNSGPRATHEYFVQLIGEKVTALEVLQVRRQLESLAAELAATNATEPEIRRLEIAIRKIEALYEKNMSGGEEDLEFHRALFAASGNALLPRIGEIILNMWLEYLGSLGKFIEHGDGFTQTTPLHRPIYEAIRSRSPKNAKKAVDEMFDLTASVIIASKKLR